MSTDLQHRPASNAARSLSTAELRDLVESIAARPEDWRHLVQFNENERWWARLPGPDGADVWILSWLDSQGTEPHDHGDSRAAFTVVQGALTEFRPSARGELVPHELAAGRTQTVAPGQIHDVLNRGASPAVSIHAYSPPLVRMTYYRETPDGLLATRTVETTEPEE